jgi:hypothetical protein
MSGKRGSVATTPKKTKKRSTADNPGSEPSKYKDSFSKRQIGGSTLFCPKEQQSFDLTNLYGKPTGASGKGVNTSGTPLGTKQQRNKRSYSRERDQQMLRQVSQKLYNAVKSTVGSEQEVEVMFVNDRIVVSANLPASIDLINQHMMDGDPTLGEFLLREGDAADSRMTAFNLKLAKRLSKPVKADDPDKDQEVRPFLTRLKDTKTSGLVEVVQLDISAVAHKDVDTSDYITNNAYKDKIILLRMTGGTQPGEGSGGVKLHAEQGLIQLALLADRDRAAVKAKPITICGGKRPCQGCLTALKLLGELGYDVDFNERPGMYWSTSCETVERLLIYVHNHGMEFQDKKTAAQYFEAMKAAAKTPPDSHVTINKYSGKEDQGFNTDSDSEVDTDEYDSEKIIDSAKRKVGDVKATAIPRLNNLVGAVKGCVLSAVVNTTPVETAIREANDALILMNDVIDEIKLARQFLAIKASELAALIEHEKSRKKPVQKKLKGFDFRAGGLQLLESEAEALQKDAEKIQKECAIAHEAFLKRQLEAATAAASKAKPDKGSGDESKMEVEVSRDK